MSPFTVLRYVVFSSFKPSVLECQTSKHIFKTVLVYMCYYFTKSSSIPKKYLNIPAQQTYTNPKVLQQININAWNQTQLILNLIQFFHMKHFKIPNHQLY